jgi:hypothetical protein
MQLFYNPNISETTTFAFDKESKHIIKVLRKKIPIFYM